MNRLALTVIGCVALSAVAFAAGARWQRGIHAQEALELRQAQDRVALQARNLELERLAMEQEAEDHVAALLEEARSDDDASLPSLGVRSARRLNQIQ